MTDRFRFPASLSRAVVAGALFLGVLALTMTGLTRETGFLPCLVTGVRRRGHRSGREGDEKWRSDNSAGAA